VRLLRGLHILFKRISRFEVSISDVELLTVKKCVTENMYFLKIVFMVAIRQIAMTPQSLVNG
jgi:hypothetical protein